MQNPVPAAKASAGSSANPAGNPSAGASESKPRPKSYTYRTTMTWAGGKAGQLEASGKPTFRVASPPEFKGEAGVWSPEDLFVASVNACTMATFVAFAERAALSIQSYTSEAEGLLELQDGSFRFTRITVRPVVRVASGQKDAADKLMHDAHAKCLVSNSMRCHVDVQANITAD